MSDYVKASHYSTRSNFVHTAKKHFKCWYHSDGSWNEGDSESIRMTVTPRWLAAGAHLPQVPYPLARTKAYPGGVT